MNSDTQTLKSLADSFVDSNRPITSYSFEMLELTKLLRRLADTRLVYSANNLMDASTVTETGVALEPWRAALSLEDQGRTVGFVRGCAQAIESVLAKTPGRPVHLIEAGCGPLAALSLPLMAHYGPEQLQVTLVDMHQTSIDTALWVIAELGLSDRLKTAACANLMEYEFSGSADVVVLEAMYAGLFREPQVALTRHLLRVLGSAIFIPQNITLNLQLLNLPLESETLPPRARERELLGQVFVLDHQSALDLEPRDGFLPAATIRIPTSLAKGQGLFLTTCIHTYDQVRVADYDAEITGPIGIPISENCLGRDLRFRYRISEYPGLEWEILPPSRRDS